MAEENPEAVDIKTVVDCLATEDPATRHEAANAFTKTLDAFPERIEPAADRLNECLNAEDPASRQGAARTVVQLADRHPEELFHTAPALRAIVERDLDYARNTAILALAKLGAEDPSVVTPAIPALHELLLEEFGMPTWERTSRALVVAARDAPADVGELLPALLGRLDTAESTAVDVDELHDDVVPALKAPAGTDAALVSSFAKHVFLTMKAIASERSDLVVPRTDALVNALSGEFEEAALASAETLGVLVDQHPDAVGQYMDELLAVVQNADSIELRWKVASVVGLLVDAGIRIRPAKRHSLITAVIGLFDTAGPSGRATAAGTLSYLGEEYPNEIAGAVPTLQSLLDEEPPVVRANTVYALGAVGTPTAREAIQSCAKSDPDETVRSAARDALELIDDR